MKKSCCVGENNSLGETVLWPDGKITWQHLLATSTNVTRQQCGLRSQRHFLYIYCWSNFIFAGSLEAAYSLNWGAQEILGKGGGETLALL